MVLIIILLYIPPVQNYIRKEVTAYASRATNMQINVERIDLRFPLKLLIRGVEVVQPPDTVLALERISANVQLLPLLKGKIELDKFTLQGAKVNTVNLISGMKLSGELGKLYLRSNGVDWSNEVAIVNNIELNDTHLHLLLNDTAKSPKDTTSTAINWKVSLLQMKLNNVSFEMRSPGDSIHLKTHIGEAIVENAEADLKQQFYGLEKLLITGTSVGYNVGDAVPANGFDPSHIALRNIHLEIDTVYSRGERMNAVIRELSLYERSGLNILSLTGRLNADTLCMRVPDLKLTTPHSELTLAAQVYRQISTPANEQIFASLDGRIGKQDVMLLAGKLPEKVKDAYPPHPLTAHIGINGNLDHLEFSRLLLTLPGAFSLTGGGYIDQIPDSTKRTGEINLHLLAQKLDFLAPLSGLPDDSSIVIPPNMNLTLKAGMLGSQYHAAMLVREGMGTLRLTADYNTSTEIYNAEWKLDSLDVRRFLPKDSIHTVALSGKLSGRGMDFKSPGTTVTLQALVDRFEYGSYRVEDVRLDGQLKNAVASAHIVSDKEYLKIDAKGEYALDKPYSQIKTEVHIARLNLYELGLIPDTLKKPIAFDLDADIGKDTINITLNSGDLRFRLRSRSTLETLIAESTGFVDVLNRQIAEKRLDHAALRRSLPSATISLNSGKENPLSYYLALQNIRYDEMRVGFIATPRTGINGRASIHTLKVDTLQLDTVYFSVRQDTSLMAIRSGIINSHTNPQLAFKASITGEIRSEDAGLSLEFENEKGEKGIELGVNMKPQPDGVLLKFGPEKPIVAFRTFAFNGHNEVFVQNNLRVLADVEMLDEKGMGVKVKSMEENDSTWLQNMDIEFRAIDLTEISKVLPYLPDVGGLFFLDANYKQSDHDLQVSAEGRVNQLHYNAGPIGDVGFGVTWFPGNEGKHYLSSYFSSEGVEVLTADGTYNMANERIDVNAALEHFSLRMVNAFIPDQLVYLTGDIDGRLAITGTPAKPVVDGELSLDSVNVSSRPYGFRFRFDNRPLQVTNSRLTFDKFAIVTTSDNPFAIDGYVDVSDLSKPTANLSLSAKNYEFLNSPRDKNSILYGKIYLDVNSTVRGPLSNLMMRGDVKILGNTDVTYVMIDSPLSVQDRLGDLVEFTSFSDTLRIKDEDKQLISLGGLDVAMTINIDQAAKVNVDLSPDRSSHVELQGGGDLAFQYTPQGQMLLTGRYVLTRGIIDYALPVIPLKKFVVSNGSYVEWSRDPMDPTLNLKATQNMRIAVANADKNSSRMVAFVISIQMKNKLNDMELAFDLSAPEDRTVQDELNAMDAAERNKQAITMMVTGMYLAGGSTGSNFNMGSAMNTVLQNQIEHLTGSALKHANISFGVDSYDGAGGAKRTDYNFSYSQRLFNDRVQVVIGGSISSGSNANESDTFIDNVSLEYRLDNSGTRYVRLFHNKEYENLLESNITETGGGIVLRKKVNKLSELFIFKKKK